MDQSSGVVGRAVVVLASWRGNGPPRLLMPTGRASVARHTGTETLPRLLREAAVENLRQWAQA